jgi:hypothetical protein
MFLLLSYLISNSRVENIGFEKRVYFNVLERVLSSKMGLRSFVLTIARFSSPVLQTALSASFNSFLFELDLGMTSKKCDPVLDPAPKTIRNKNH